MNLTLEKATETDAESIYYIQLQAFEPLLHKYKDFDTNPANESIDRLMSRIHHPYGGFYKILVENILVGAICVFHKEGTSQYWISPMFIKPEEQGKGIAQKALTLIENLFPHATSWELATILEEKGNVYLYEKMGYERTGVLKKLNDIGTLVYYKKKKND